MTDSDQEAVKAAANPFTYLSLARLALEEDRNIELALRWLEKLDGKLWDFVRDRD